MKRVKAELRGKPIFCRYIFSCTFFPHIFAANFQSHALVCARVCVEYRWGDELERYKSVFRRNTVRCGGLRHRRRSVLQLQKPQSPVLSKQRLPEENFSSEPLWSLKTKRVRFISSLFKFTYCWCCDMCVIWFSLWCLRSIVKCI